MKQKKSTSSRGNWFTRHKVLIIILVVAAVLIAVVVLDANRLNQELYQLESQISW